MPASDLSAEIRLGLNPVRAWLNAMPWEIRHVRLLSHVQQNEFENKNTKIV